MERIERARLARQEAESELGVLVDYAVRLGIGWPEIAAQLGVTRQGRRVRYITTAALVNELVEAADQRALSRLAGRYGRLDLLLLDELGYVQVDPRGAELLFQIITEREERASIGIGTNLPFSEWGTVFPDPRLVAAIVDRVTFNAHILETGTQSYRLRTSKTTSRSRKPS
jgi:DNA replication protein DnaC